MIYILYHGINAKARIRKETPYSYQLTILNIYPTLGQSRVVDMASEEDICNQVILFEGTVRRGGGIDLLTFEGTVRKDGGGDIFVFEGTVRKDGGDILFVLICERRSMSKEKTPLLLEAVAFPFLLKSAVKSPKTTGCGG